jgi:hypothetical protein
MPKSKQIDETIEEVSLHDIMEEFETNSVLEEIAVDNSMPILQQDPIAMQVKALRLRGFDDNRIAAMLGVSRTHVVDKIQ